MIDSAKLERHREQMAVLRKLEIYIETHVPEILKPPGVVYIPAVGKDLLGDIRPLIEESLEADEDRDRRTLVPVGLTPEKYSDLYLIEVDMPLEDMGLADLPDSMPMSEVITAMNQEDVWKVPIFVRQATSDEEYDCEPDWITQPA